MEMNHALSQQQLAHYGFNSLETEMHSIKYSILDAACSTQNFTKSITDLRKSTAKLNQHLDRLERLADCAQENIRRIKEE